MIEKIKRIGELQLEYSSDNTPAMQERGKLIRHGLPDDLRNHFDSFRPCLGRFSNELEIDARDGIGRKTTAAWVRLFSRELSPKATVGYYVVIHFSSDGKRCYVTVGCASTRWDPDVGDLVKHSDNELKEKTSWALDECRKAGVSIDGFTDTIDLGAATSLVEAFEKATILACAYDIESITEKEFVSSICEALKILSVIYESYSQLSDLPNSEIDRHHLETAINPKRSRVGGRQGYGLSGAERKVVELRAMKITREHLESQGYQVKDTSKNRSYDFIAKNQEEEIKVEVKGTTSSKVDSILMSANEVELHTLEKGTTALAIVSSIVLTERGENPKCEGGKLEYMPKWDITKWTKKPTSFQVKRPS